MSWLETLASRMFPGATVRLLEHTDAFRVSVDVRMRDVMASRDVDGIRNMAEKLKPLRPVPRGRRRRLHWGRSKWGRR